MVDLNKMGRTFRQNTVADVGLKTGPHKQRFSRKKPTSRELVSRKGRDLFEIKSICALELYQYLAAC